MKKEKLSILMVTQEMRHATNYVSRNVFGVDWFPKRMFSYYV